jgi:hypothetical protein
MRQVGGCPAIHPILNDSLVDQHRTSSGGVTCTAPKRPLTAAGATRMAAGGRGSRILRLAPAKTMWSLPATPAPGCCNEGSEHC